MRGKTTAPLTAEAAARATSARETSLNMAITWAVREIKSGGLERTKRLKEWSVQRRGGRKGRRT